MLTDSNCRRCACAFQYVRSRTKRKIYCEPCRPEAHKEQIRAYQAKAKATRPPRAEKPAFVRRDCASEVAKRAVTEAKRALGCRTCGGALTGKSWKFCCTRCKRGYAPANYQTIPCPECATTFTQKALQQRFCSTKCSRRHGDRINTRARRAKARDGEKVNPVEVFMRDGWKCQLCGCKTPRKLMGKQDPRAPTLDHIIPLSKGGEHTYRNTQCACYHCNCVVKRANAGGQLRLFG